MCSLKEFWTSVKVKAKEKYLQVNNNKQSSNG